MVKHVRVWQTIYSNQLNRADETMKEDNRPGQNIFTLAAKRASWQKVRSATMRRLRHWHPRSFVSATGSSVPEVTPTSMISILLRVLASPVQDQSPPVCRVVVGDAEKAKEIFHANCFEEVYGEPYEPGK